MESYRTSHVAVLERWRDWTSKLRSDRQQHRSGKGWQWRFQHFQIQPPHELQSNSGCFLPTSGIQIRSQMHRIYSNRPNLGLQQQLRSLLVANVASIPKIKDMPLDSTRSRWFILQLQATSCALNNGVPCRCPHCLSSSNSRPQNGAQSTKLQLMSIITCESTSTSRLPALASGT